MGLNTFWKWISGRLRKEREWAELPRKVPEEFQNLPDGDHSWLMSREFLLGKNVMRTYLAAEQVDDDEWNIRICNRSMDSDRLSTVCNCTVYSALEVVEKLSAYERAHENKGMTWHGDEEITALPQSKPTYFTFANENGIHFDKRGQAYKVEKNIAAMKEATVTRKSLDKIYNAEAVKKADLSSWNSLHKFLDAKKPAVSDDDLGQDEHWKYFALQAVRKLHGVSGLAADAEAEIMMPSRLKRKLDVIAGENLVFICEFGVTEGFKTEERNMAACHMFYSSMLLGVLHAGTALAGVELAKGIRNIDPQAQKAIRAIGDLAVTIVTERFDVRDGSAADVANLIMQGADPRGNALPIDKMLEKFPVEIPPARPKKSRRRAERPPQTGQA